MGAIAEMSKAVYLQNTEKPMNPHESIKDFLKGAVNTYRKKELKE